MSGAEPMDRPAVVVRIVWPKERGHADAVKAIGRALAAMVAEHTYPKPRRRSSFDYGWNDHMEETAEHFKLTIRHEVEP